MSSEDQKSKSKSVSLMPDLWERVETKAKDEYRGNRSEYIRVLIERDLDTPNPAIDADALSPMVIDDLAKRLCGELVARRLSEAMPKQAKPYSQPALLKALLDGLDRFFEEEGYFPMEDTIESAPWIVNSTFLPLHTLLSEALQVAERNLYYYEHMLTVAYEEAAMSEMQKKHDKWEARFLRLAAAHKALGDEIARQKGGPIEKPDEGFSPPDDRPPPSASEIAKAMNDKRKASPMRPTPISEEAAKK